MTDERRAPPTGDEDLRSKPMADLERLPVEELAEEFVARCAGRAADGRRVRRAATRSTRPRSATSSPPWS